MAQDIIEEIQAYCEAAGISPSTLGVRALGNSRYFDRLKRRLDKTAEDADRLRTYMAENPPRGDAA